MLNNIKNKKKHCARKKNDLKDIFLKAKFTETTLGNDLVNFSVYKYNTKNCSWCKNLVGTTITQSNKNNKVSKLSII